MMSQESHPVANVIPDVVSWTECSKKFENRYTNLLQKNSPCCHVAMQHWELKNDAEWGKSSFDLAQRGDYSEVGAGEGNRTLVLSAVGFCGVLRGKHRGNWLKSAFVYCTNCTTQIWPQNTRNKDPHFGGSNLSIKMASAVINQVVSAAIIQKILLKRILW